MTYLVTGTKSGLGRYLHEQMAGLEISRETGQEEFRKFQVSGVDLIVHCAWNATRPENAQELYQSFQDNFLFTKQLLTIPHRKFIFLSSVDVYPKDSCAHNEDEIINPEEIAGIYGLTKYLTESLVRADAQDWIILRPTSLLGRYSRKNSAMRILLEEHCSLTLSADSTFNYIRHYDVLNLINYALKQDLTGTYNVASGDNITLSDAAIMFGKKVSFGNHRYDVGHIENRKVASILPAFQRSSREVLFTFHQELHAYAVAGTTG